MEQNYDVVIIGTGVAGLYGALHLDKRLKVLIICKRDITLSNSSLAQGGVAAVTRPDYDDVRYHIEDTLIAGGHQNDLAAVTKLCEEGPKEVRHLMELGVDFDTDAEGKTHLTLEGGHSKPRILHHKDCTGREIVNKLILNVKKQENITIWEHSIVVGLEKRGDGFAIDALYDDEHHDNEHCFLAARYVMLCTGGIGRVYRYTTNSAIATGDGIALAYQMGARIKNLSFVQFHPTAFAGNVRERFLISESVRGEGAKLLNCHGQQFMTRYDPRGELAPRDVVSKGIMAEQKRVGSDKFYLDISYKDPKFIKERFPMIYAALLVEGYDLTKDPIPVYPCQHYLMGGIDVDLNSATTVDGLYACGECSHTGVHGANRLASNSLLEALVFSHAAANHINARSLTEPASYPDPAFPADRGRNRIPKGIRTEIRAIMQEADFVVPDPEKAAAGLARILEIRRMLLDGGFMMSHDYFEALSLATIACLILQDVSEKGDAAPGAR
ncbi:L-aspartate oxidase [Zongyangia hominis]|uniref:L-aspartate oxidase n=1 Tax=Zongyangia hominis TaxID=2763677 RepID=A0A926I6N0_9FIRM|nr:L-aspartate oxidase [Zongyangia hominis]MBC8570224.1 L-aspartate oxidase [Zongyangia hominis]